MLSGKWARKSGALHFRKVSIQEWEPISSNRVNRLWFVCLLCWQKTGYRLEKYLKRAMSPDWVYVKMVFMAGHLSYVWDYDIDAEQFREILAGKRTFGRLDQDWAARRLLEYAPYEEIVDLIGFCRLIENWPRWRPYIRSQSRKRGFDFLVLWLPQTHPELCHD